ncbi:glycoside hydrolase family 95 protein [Paenibacillus sp. P26]|nr:glycoside hydrolase family 95 protein [Paenibacillus sp. P26]
MSLAEQVVRESEIRLREEQWEARKGVFLQPPQHIPTGKWTDAPLLGNGDVGVAIGGGAEEQTLYIGKNDFWVQPHLGETEEQRRERPLSDNGRRTGARIITVGQVTLLLPGLQGVGIPAGAAYPGCGGARLIPGRYN